LRSYFKLGCYLAALAVVLGAFGAHALKTMLAPDLLAVFETAVRYQMYGALGVQLAALARPRSTLGIRFLLIGVAIFSGSLYLLCITGFRWLGAVTPFGGVSLIAGWVLIGHDAVSDDHPGGTTSL
jgi:uncharacterized membrane protein YgdD (TMEM256/DUF423 family)